MAANLPQELKQLKRFVREAKKTEKVSPVIAYYCRLYAIQEAMKLDESKKTAATKQWLMTQMDQLEANKVEVSREEAQQTITTMAHNVFKHADQIDRAGNANKSTAAAFNSAFVFYSILKQFGERDDAIVEAAKYCMFKTADILKALREGRKPKPGPPGDEEDAALNAELNAINADDGAIQNGGGAQPESAQPSQPQPAEPQQPQYQAPAQPQYQQPQQPQQPPFQAQPAQPQYHAPMQPQAQAQPQGQPMQQGGAQGYYVNNAPQYNYQQRVQLPRFEKKVEACVEAEKTLKEAMAALRFEDVDTAIKKSQEAIAILQPHNR